MNTTENGRAVKDEREAVLLALLSHEKNNTFSNVLVKRTLDGCGHMTQSERAFIKRLLEGVIERKTELDARIGDLTGKPVSRLHPAVHQILRMGLYQILYMDAVPDSAACNEAVKLAKRHAPKRLSGFVNGVLRSAARAAGQEAGQDAAGAAGSGGQEPAQVPVQADPRDNGEAQAEERAGQPQGGRKGAPAAGGDWIGAQERRFSMPAWIVAMWEAQLGREETEKLLTSLMEIRPVSARFCGAGSAGARDALLEELREAGAQVEPGRWLPDSFRLRKTSDLTGLPGFADGRWTVQDESSMLAVEAAGLSGTEAAYDVCAAPGGKTFLMAQKLLLGGGTVHAFDLTRRKTDRIREGARRLHLPNIVVGEQDARLFVPEHAGKADVLLCDLPCSGLGVIGKKRDIKYRASPEGIAGLQDLQREILGSAVRCLRPGGILLYSTCTISAAENGENAAWIREELGMVPDALSPWLPEGLPGICGNTLQLLPHVHGTDGFFIARFRKP